MAISGAVSHFCGVLEGKRPPGRSRAPGVALALLVLAISGAPTALAQPPCGPDLPLAANEWIMVGVPCEPDPAANEIGDVFGASPGLGAGNYGSTWIVYYRVYQESGGIPNDFYVAAAVTDTVEAGDAYWIWTDVPATLVAPVNATPTDGPSVPVPPGENFPFPAIQAESNTDPRYYLFGNPFEETVEYADFRWTGLLLGFIPVNEPTSSAVLFSVTTGIVHYWNGNSYDTKSYNSIPDPADFVPKEAAWLEFLQGVSPFIANLTVHVPDPSP